MWHTCNIRATYVQIGVCQNTDRAVPSLFSRQYKGQDLTSCELPDFPFTIVETNAQSIESIPQILDCDLCSAQLCTHDAGQRQWGTAPEGHVTSRELLQYSMGGWSSCYAWMSRRLRSIRSRGTSDGSSSPSLCFAKSWLVALHGHLCPKQPAAPYEMVGIWTSRSLWISLERSIRLWEELIGLDFVIIC